MRRQMASFALLVMLCAIACSHRPLDRKRTGEIISHLYRFKVQAFYSFATGQPITKGTFAFACVAQADAERAPANALLVELGWVRFEARTALIGFNDRANCPALVLTEQGRAASAAWKSRAGVPAGSTVWSVPVGERTFLEVTGLTAAPDGSTLAEFTWKWTPNGTGDTLKRTLDKARAFFDRTRQGSASCQLWDDGWSCRLANMGASFEDVGSLELP
jgi:hypothetical protein